MRKLVTLLVGLAVVASACKKPSSKESDQQNPDLTSNVKSIQEMVVRDGFNYDANQIVSLEVSVAKVATGNQMYKVSVYDGNPTGNGNLIASGGATSSSPFKKEVKIPTAIDYLYLVTTAPDGSSETRTVSARSKNIVVDGLGKRSVTLMKTMPASPDCNTGCSSTVTGNTNVSLNNASSVVCITGNFSGNIDINNGTVRICGNANVSGCNLNNNSTLLIAAGATVTFSNLNINTSACTFKNWSSNVTVNGTFSPNGVVTNYGTLNVSSDFNINGSAVVTNEGTINVQSTFNNNKTCYNNGTMNINGSFNQNGGGLLVNNCKMIINQSAAINNPITNNSYISVAQSTTINGGGILNMADGSMYQTSNMTINNRIAGTGSTSLVKVSGNTTINGGGNISGAIQYCDANGIETNWGTIASGVSLACNLYIPTSSCNPSGNGVIVYPDADGDGANDNVDEFPNDADKAFNNYYPNDKDMATVAFEDLWPSKGDYDLNDLVVDFRHNIITNAKGEAVAFEGNYRLRAAGGAQRLGFGVQLPVASDNVSKIEGASLEKDQKQAVIMLFEDSKSAISGWNTVPDQQQVDFKEYNVTVAFDKPVGDSKELLTVSEYNPFIWVNEKESGKGRGYEIHLPGKMPTDLADQSVFRYADDDTNLEKGKSYLTRTNLPWAILVPTTFDYCIELSKLGSKEPLDITQVYLHFAQWAQSNGEIYRDWYIDEKEYRAGDYIYQWKK